MNLDSLRIWKINAIEQWTRKNIDFKAKARITGTDDYQALDELSKTLNLYPIGRGWKKYGATEAKKIMALVAGYDLQKDRIWAPVSEVLPLAEQLIGLFDESTTIYCNSIFNQEQRPYLRAASSLTEDSNTVAFAFCQHDLMCLLLISEKV